MSRPNPHDELRNFLQSKGYNCPNESYGDEFYNDSIFDLLFDDSPKIKDGNYINRFRDVISDPNNLFIERHELAGKIEGDKIYLHNGIKIFNEYYSNFSDVLSYNLGVHEPSEERAFQKVLSKLKPNSTMVELGSYWAFYSIWFMKQTPNSISYCIEPSDYNIDLGKKNFELNSLNYEITPGLISNDSINVSEFIKNKNIDLLDILHCDIQGNELIMLNQIKEDLVQRKIKYIFVSTHSNELHNDCLKFLPSVGYKILCSCDFDYETYQWDGFILSCPNELDEISPFKIGNRSKSFQISNQFFNKLIK